MMMMMMVVVMVTSVRVRGSRCKFLRHGVVVLKMWKIIRLRSDCCVDAKLAPSLN